MEYVGSIERCRIREMQKSSDILKLRTLLYFLKQNQEDCTVTQIACTFGEEKYTISRAMISLEKENLLNRENPRKPRLTEKGIEEANTYSERVEIIMNHLMYEGVDAASAKEDALYWALYSSEQSIEMFRSAEVRYHVKYEMRNKKNFNGETLCKKMKDGVYKFPFLIYREHVKEGNNISMANDAFENPCILCVKDGVGTIQLRAQTIVKRSVQDGAEVRGKVKGIKYLTNGSYVNAEYYGNILSFPASALNFVNMGNGIGQILQGSVCMKMESIVDNKVMPEHIAIFTITI